VVDAILERLKRLHPKLIDLALDRIERLLAALGHPEDALPPVVHIAGTNGKGSTLAYLRAIAEAGGLRVHVYTSPHLVRFAERIRVASTIVGEDELAAILEECERANAGAPITFFEVTTAAAFLAFARHRADLCLLETGLGGKYDATNVLPRPALTLLSPISFDHEAFLGNTLAAIAGEKAGIIKRGVVCLSAAQAQAAMAVIAARAEALAAPLSVEGRAWRTSPTATGIRFEQAGRTIELPPPSLPGAHQIGNAGLAVAAARALDGMGALPGGIDAAALGAGIARVEWPARLQLLTRGLLVASLPKEWELWLDGGHNPAAGEALARMADEWAARGGAPPLDLVMGMLDTKDARGFLAPFAGKVRTVRTVVIPGEAHAVPAEALAASAAAAGLSARPSPGVAEALADLARAAGPARVLVCGSLYLAGTVLAQNG